MRDNQLNFRGGRGGGETRTYEWQTAARLRPLLIGFETQEVGHAIGIPEIFGEQQEKVVNYVGLVDNTHEIEKQIVVDKDQTQPRAQRIHGNHQQNGDDMFLRRFM